jgi:HD-GYP domain-containing protein (c-di-GMP phosphodiesterase class II)
LTGKDLSLESRILTVADIYGALHETRPYRAGLEYEQIRDIMFREVPQKLDADCVEALMIALNRANGHSGPVQAEPCPGGVCSL